MSEFGTTRKFSVPLERVLDLLCDQDHTRRKYARMGHGSFEPLGWESEGPARTLHTRRRVPLDVPRFARKILGEDNVIEQRERWEDAGDGTWRNTWSIDVKGSPITISGTAHLRPTPGGCEEEVKGRVSCSVPLVGGKIAAFVARDSQKGLLEEDSMDREALGEV